MNPNDKPETAERPLVMRFVINSDSAVYEGNLTVPDDNGTSTLPMMVHLLIKNIATDRPELHASRKLKIEVELTPA